MSKYTVNVGNIGNIEFSDKFHAELGFKEYVRMSKDNYGRCSGESVYLLDKNGEPIKEFFGTIAKEELSD